MDAYFRIENNSVIDPDLIIVPKSFGFNIAYNLTDTAKVVNFSCSHLIENRGSKHLVCNIGGHRITLDHNGLPTPSLEGESCPIFMEGKTCRFSFEIPLTAKVVES